MPDGDKIHPKLGNRHQGIYKQICEEAYSEEEIAYNELAPLRKELQAYGDAPLELIRQAVDIFNQNSASLLVDWNAMNRSLEKISQRISQQTCADKRGLSLALEACKKILHGIRYGNSPSDLGLKITQEYMIKVYEAQFEGRIPLVHHYNNADPTMVNLKVREMRPFIERGVEHFAGQLANGRSVTSLRRPQRDKPKIGLHDSLV